VKIITQEGAPVSDIPPEESEEYAPEEDIRAIAEDIHKGLRRFRNNTILKVGAVIVALRIVNIAGAIIIENQRLKAKQKQQDDEK
jgi:hypothetical protein